MLILPIVVIYKCKLENSASLNTLLKCESNEFIKEIFVYNNSPGEIFIPDYYMGLKFIRLMIIITQVLVELIIKV